MSQQPPYETTFKFTRSVIWTCTKLHTLINISPLNMSDFFTSRFMNYSLRHQGKCGKTHYLAFLDLPPDLDLFQSGFFPDPNCVYAQLFLIIRPVVLLVNLLTAGLHKSLYFHNNVELKVVFVRLSVICNLITTLFLTFTQRGRNLKVNCQTRRIKNEGVGSSGESRNSDWLFSSKFPW